MVCLCGMHVLMCRCIYICVCGGKGLTLGVFSTEPRPHWLSNLQCWAYRLCCCAWFLHRIWIPTQVFQSQRATLTLSLRQIMWPSWTRSSRLQRLKFHSNNSRGIKILFIVFLHTVFSLSCILCISQEPNLQKTAPSVLSGLDLSS